jgi:hypothetical protein
VEQRWGKSGAGVEQKLSRNGPEVNRRGESRGSIPAVQQGAQQVVLSPLYIYILGGGGRPSLQRGGKHQKQLKRGEGG